MTEQYRITAQSLDWVEIITTALTARAKALNMDLATVKTPPFTIRFDQSGAIYMVDKDFLPADVLGRALGKPAEAVAAATNITLRPLKGTENWQKPTVADIGHA